MTFTPIFQERSESLIIDNILTFVKRDFKAALDYFYPLGAAGTPLLDDVIARPLGTTTLHMDGFTVKPAVNDLFTVAGDMQVYEVISATTLVGTDSDVTFRPGLKVAIPAVDGNEAVTFTGQADFAQRTLGRFFRLEYPAFAIDAGRSGPLQSADGSYVEDSLKVNIFFAVEDVDAPSVERKAMRYMTALKAVLRKAERTGDYLTGFTANTVLPLTMELSYEYGLIGKSPMGYEKPVSVELLLKFGER